MANDEEKRAWAPRSGQARPRQENIEADAQKVAAMREMLAKPGGEDAVRKRFGEAAVGGTEHRAAQRQAQANRQRVRRTAERAANAAPKRQPGSVNQVGRDQAQARLKDGQKQLRQAQQQPADGKTKTKAQVHAAGM
ncbi:hypothetical protein ABH922_001792 [Rhodococcus sp. 27YEA15]|uniref:hypothetical protein n=1 Tax=Rhodococcus sp. 27YEA15 TaxID=3156259 RepID=UPI003C7C88FA